MDIFFSNDTLTEEEMMKGIVKGLPARGIFPIFCVNARTDLGVKRLMEFIADVAPSPDKMAPVKDTEGREIKCDSSAKPVRRTTAKG
jgi:elongation factor G